VKDDGLSLVREAERRLRRQLGLAPARGERGAAPGIFTSAPEGNAHGGAQVRVEAWFAARGMQPFAFQREVWARYRAGESGLLHASTGTGKTLAAWLGPVMEAIDGGQRVRGLKVLWVTPMRALATDTFVSLAAPLSELGLAWRVALRTGDTAPGERARQERLILDAQVTTPESLSLMLTRPDLPQRFGSLRLVVVDEWHELLGSKRGVQVELALARLRRIAPGLRVWGLSATLGNVQQACEVLLPQGGAIVAAPATKPLVIDALLPHDILRFPWAGHLGIHSVAEVAAEIEGNRTTLVFCNVRSHAEAWYQALLDHRPDWAGLIGLHHGSMDPQARRWVEDGLRAGTLKAAVCTSSLDLGVDFSPVDRVIQVGSPKSVARLIQRAGRSGHRPGATSRVTCVPTHALELLEAAAARSAAAEQALEPRAPLRAPLDVLIQHVITLAVGEGFEADALYHEVRETAAYRTLERAQWQWVLDFAGGGGVLSAYPEYRRIERDARGIHRVTDGRLARRHRAQVGTIVSDASVDVQFVRGARLGSVEESFLARLQPGERFVIAGRTVELVRMRDLTAYVRRAAWGKARVPRWLGGKLSLSGQLGGRVRETLARTASGEAPSPELTALAPLLALQQRHSVLPAADQLLVERHRTRAGWHLCVFAFAGRHVHAGLAALMAWRLARGAALTFSMAFNDYGFELLSDRAFECDAARVRAALRSEDLEHDLAASINAAELARRQFREIARVAGLVFQGYPGQGRSAKQMQLSSGLLYDVYARHDPDNPLLAQARAEVLERELELSRLRATVQALAREEIVLTQPARLTPLALPLIAEQMRNALSSEQLAERVERMRQAILAPAAGTGRRRARGD